MYGNFNIHFVNPQTVSTYHLLETFSSSMSVLKQNMRNDVVIHFICRSLSPDRVPRKTKRLWKRLKRFIPRRSWQKVYSCLIDSEVDLLSALSVDLNGPLQTLSQQPRAMIMRKHDIINVISA